MSIEDNISPALTEDDQNTAHTSQAEATARPNETIPERTNLKAPEEKKSQEESSRQPGPAEDMSLTMVDAESSPNAKPA